MEHKFQINLRGIIDLLSNHLYSTPEVFVRELLQNAVDALRARTYLEPGFEGKIEIEVTSGRGKRPSTLAFLDDGVGLTEDEIHQFLATIGRSSKRSELWGRATDFIGQFGIGLLSAFVVADEITVLTRSVRGAAPSMEWRGRPDGTYSLRELEESRAPGTQVYLTCKEGCEEFFDARRIAERVAHFGSMLPFPILLTTSGRTRRINEHGAPWRRKYRSVTDESRSLLEYGKRTFDAEFFDCIPLESKVGAVDGVAFVLPFSPSLATKRTHRVYLKNMLLSETAENLLPEWAFFVKCVVNADDLRPTASRESFYEDKKLEAAREALGRCLRDYLVDLAGRDPERLQRLIGLHYLSIKALAVQDDDFYRMFIDWLPFETSMGQMTLGEYRSKHPILRYVPDLDQFRQIARIAAAQSLCVINAGYTYDAELLGKYQDVFPEVPTEELDPGELAQEFEDLTLDERDLAFELARTADIVLQPFRCTADVKKFLPVELPALYSPERDAEFLRNVEQSKEVSDSFWSSVLDNLAGERSAGPYARLYFNFQNPLIREIAAVTDRELLRRCIELLYAQALLLGHHALSAKELALLNEGLIGFIQWGVKIQANKDATKRRSPREE